MLNEKHGAANDEFDFDDRLALRTIRLRALFWVAAYMLLLFGPVFLYFVFYVPRWY